MEDVVYKFDICLESLHGLQPKEGCKYSVKWKRGEKLTGRTEQLGDSQMGIVVLNHRISFNSTMQKKDRSRYYKKTIEFYINEHCVRKGKAEKRHVAEVKADLADALNCNGKTMVLRDKNGGEGALMISVTSAPAAGTRPRTLSVPGQDSDSHTDRGATSIDGNSEMDDMTASVADDSEFGADRAITPKLHHTRDVSNRMQENRSTASPRLSVATNHKSDHAVENAVSAAVNLDLERRLKEAEAKIHALEVEKERMAIELKNAEQTGKQHRSTLDTQENSLQAKVDETMAQLEEVRRNADETKVRCSQLRKELDAKNLECQCLTEQTSIFSTEMGMLQEEVERYKLQIEECNEQVTELSETLHKEQANYMSQLEDLQEEVTHKNALLEKAERMLAEARQLCAEAHALDRLILWASPCFLPEGIPVAAVGVFRQLMEWKAFDMKNNPNHHVNTFLENIGVALDRICEAKSQDRCLAAYWVSSLWWLLSLMDREFSMCQVKRHLHSSDVIQEVKAKLIQRLEDRHVRESKAKPGTHFYLPYVGTDDGLPVIRTSQSKPNTSDDVSDTTVLHFCTNLLLVLTDFLVTLVQSMLTALDSIVVRAVFEPLQKGTESLRPRKTMADLLLLLDSLYGVTTEAKLPGRIRDMVFSVMFTHINALIFNNFVERQEMCSLSTALHLKATVRELEKWQHERALSKACRSRLSHITQVANMLTLKKELLMEPQTRAGVCPALHIQQIFTILRHYSADELDSEGVPDEVTAHLEEECLAIGSQSLTLPTQHDIPGILLPAASEGTAPGTVDWLSSIGDVPCIDVFAVDLPEG